MGRFVRSVRSTGRSGPTVGVSLTTPGAGELRFSEFPRIGTCVGGSTVMASSYWGDGGDEFRPSYLLALRRPGAGRAEVAVAVPVGTGGTYRFSARVTHGDLPAALEDYGRRGGVVDLDDTEPLATVTELHPR